jgi:anti-anti-sigma factor
LEWRPREAAVNSEPFSVTVEWSGSTCIVRVTGEIDMATAPALERCLTGLAGDAVVDFSGVRFMDSTGVAVLARAMKRASDHDVTFSVRGLRPALRQVLDITGLAEHLNIEDE